MEFTNSQIEFMKSLGIKVDFDKSIADMSEDEFCLIEDIVAYTLQTKGFDEEYEPTSIGKMCESILDKLGEF